MRLSDLIAGAGLDVSSRSRLGGAGERAGIFDGREIEIAGLAYRSESVTPGTLFFCVPGFTVDGHDFAPDAVARGAAALVCERPLGLDVPEIVVERAGDAMAPLAASFYGQPSGSLEVVGVTGTNGKTTTTFLVRDVLEAAGRRTGLLGTVHSVVGGEVQEVERTTPEAVDLQYALRRMVDAGDSACVMEVSSHALELHRAAAIQFDCAVFTNLSQDHLDFHGTLGAYFDAKRLLFCPGSGPGPRTCVVNVDDEWGRRLADELARQSDRRVVTFSVEGKADYRAADVESSDRGLRFRCLTPGRPLPVSLPLPGAFNVHNALACVAASCSIGVAPEIAARALGEAGRVPGRFEPVDEGQDFGVVVDYAHSPDSLANVLRAARELLAERGGQTLFCVFGAGGDRDRAKRPLMGEAARRLADHVIVTSDNPRSEEPEAIIAAIVRGAERACDSPAVDSALEVEPDRRAAIARALRLARADDVVVIAGKGHEQGQELAEGRKIPFDDRDVARQELRALRSSAARPTGPLRTV